MSLSMSVTFACVGRRLASLVLLGVAAEMLDSYWNPLWQWSQRAAVSGDGGENCVFRQVIK